MSQLFVSIQSHTKEKESDSTLITTETPEWYIIDNEEPPRNQATLPDKTLPTMA